MDFKPKKENWSLKLDKWYMNFYRGYGGQQYYGWEINLDKFLFIGSFDGFTCTFTLKQIYLVLLNKTTRKKNIVSWIIEVEKKLRNLHYTNIINYVSFSRQYHATMIQKTVRLYLFSLRELKPGTGILFFLAKKRFQERIG